MPVQKMWRPAYFGLSTVPPRRIAISVCGSRRRGRRRSRRSAASTRLGVEEARILHQYDRRLAAAYDRRRTEVDLACRGIFGEPRERFRLRQQHRVTQMRAGLLVRHHMREEDALVDLDAVPSRSAPGRAAPRPRRATASGRDQVGGRIDERLGAHEFAVMVGERRIHMLDVRAQERLAGLAAHAQQPSRPAAYCVRLRVGFAGSVRAIRRRSSRTSNAPARRARSPR